MIMSYSIDFFACAMIKLQQHFNCSRDFVCGMCCIESSPSEAPSSFEKSFKRHLIAEKNAVYSWITTIIALRFLINVIPQSRSNSCSNFLELTYNQFKIRDGFVVIWLNCRWLHNTVTQKCDGLSSAFVFFFSPWQNLVIYNMQYL